MKSKHWAAGWLAIVIVGLLIIGGWIYKIDPYIHYHMPDTTRYFYILNNQRSQNNGIVRFFDYDALLTGTSMTETFKPSEMDEIFGTHSIKAPFSGATYKEVNDNLKTAIANNPDLKIVVRGIDMDWFFDDKDRMRDDLGEFPTYLYDSNFPNDVRYVLNRDVIWGRAFPMTIANNKEDFEPGITSFDDYSQWKSAYTFGVDSVCPDGIPEIAAGEKTHLSDSEKEIIEENIAQNITSLANENPDITFYYFFTPYGAAWWMEKVADGSVYKQIEAEEYVIEKILDCENIKLFSFNNRTDITCDLNNYMDRIHYGPWINSLFLRWMHDGKYQLTKDNYKDYLAKELDNYTKIDYYSLNDQIDYDNDLYAAALFHKEFSGVEPLDLLQTDDDKIVLMSAAFVDDQYNGDKGIECTGTLKRSPDSEASVFEHITTADYVGANISVNDIGKYSYLVFYGKKISDHGQPGVYVINEAGENVGEITENYDDLDGEWHQYIIDVSDVTGDANIVFNGGYPDITGSPDSKYVFSCIYLY